MRLGAILGGFDNEQGRPDRNRPFPDFFVKFCFFVFYVFIFFSFSELSNSVNKTVVLYKKKLAKKA